MLRMLLIVGAALLVTSTGCKRLPNPETDEVARMLRYLDETHRPDGGDLPVERYFAWESKRDAGTRPNDELTAGLQKLVDQQLLLVKRLRRLRTSSENGQAIIDAYLGAHEAAHLAMEDTLWARRMSDWVLEERVRAGVVVAMGRLRKARELRSSVCEMLEVRQSRFEAEAQ